MKLPSSSIFVVLLPMTLTACGNVADPTGSGGGGASASSTASGGPGSPEMKLAKFCADVTAPYCQALFTCCTTDQNTLMVSGGSEAGCETTFGAECQGRNTDDILPHLKAGDTVLNEPRLAACVARLASMKAGGAACTRPPGFVLLDDCFAAFEGKIAAGAACDATDLGDTSFIVCDKGDCTSGKCVPFLALGAPCQDPDIAAGGCNYVDGEYCHITSGAGKCTPVGKVGDKACDVDTDPGFSCDSTDCGVSFQCIAPTPDRLCKLL